MKQLNDIVKPVLALMVVIFSFTYFFVCLFSDHKPDPQIIIAIVAAMQIPLNYFFGNSSGAAKKDEIIQQNIDNQK